MDLLHFATLCVRNLYADCSGTRDQPKYLQRCIQSDIRVPEIEYFQTRQLRVRSEQDVPVELDGELAGSCPVEFQMYEKALPVLSPARIA